MENFRLLDQQCHQCVYDRKYSQLPEIPMEENMDPVVSSNNPFGANNMVRAMMVYMKCLLDASYYIIRIKNVYTNTNL